MYASLQRFVDISDDAPDVRGHGNKVDQKTDGTKHTETDRLQSIA